jgi:DNA polymerase-3 subunit delta'
MLKTLEDPQGNRLFILLADSSDQVDATLRSRCQVVRIPPRAEDEIAAWLIQVHGVAVPRAGQIARVAGGWPGRALAILRETGEEPAVGLDREDLLTIFTEEEPARMLEVAHRLAERKVDAQSLSIALRDVWLQEFGALEATAGAMSPLASDDRIRIAAGWPLSVLRQVDVVVAAAVEAQAWNGNAELNWDVLLLRLQQLGRSHRSEAS